MKLKFLVLCLVIICINSQIQRCEDFKSESDCTGKKDYKDRKCCFYEIEFDKDPDIYDYYGNHIKTKNEKYCDSIEKFDYDNIKSFAKAMKVYLDYAAKSEEDGKNNNKLKKYSIKCQSTFLKFGFVALIAALLL